MLFGVNLQEATFKHQPTNVFILMKRESGYS